MGPGGELLLYTIQKCASRYKYELQGTTILGGWNLVPRREVNWFILAV